MAVLFDLDGTLIDTAPDFYEALINFSAKYNLDILPNVDFNFLRSIVSDGSRTILKNTISGYDDLLTNDACVNNFISCYKETKFLGSKLFQGMQEILKVIESNDMSWGIVTNKPEYLTFPLLTTLNILPKPSCVVSGDSAAKAKPHPDPIIMACDILGVEPKECIYVGDAIRDIQAAQSCNMPAIAVEYGYIKYDDDPKLWNADYLAADTSALLKTLYTHFGWQQ